MKRFLLPFLLLVSLAGMGQAFNNEWINYSRTYYKFKIAANGLFRINQPVLAAAGLGGVPAEQFQLWRNGQQIPIYTSVQTGVFSPADFIEFWGEMNDGKPDRDLYRLPDYMLNEKWSHETDTAFYFLTVNPAGGNFRLTPTANTIPGGAIPEPYFMHNEGTYFRERFNNGFAAVVGEYVYSSSYDKGEGIAAGDLGTGATRTITYNNLQTFTGPGAPQPVLKVNASGNTLTPRTVEARVNSTLVGQQTMDFFDYIKASFNVDPALISGGTASIGIRNGGTTAGDRMAIATVELIYPRQFNFNGANAFLFGLPANPAGNYLEIANFNHGGTAPVLLDLTNGRRYVCDISNPALVRVFLQGSSSARNLLLVTQVSTYPQAVTSLQARNFINYAAAGNQGDFLIITHSALLNGSGGTTPVEDYRQYRSSAPGGSYTAKIYMIDQLIDQFAFGIKQHPLSVRNFIRWARANFSAPIKNVFIIGKGLNYQQNRLNEANANIDRLSFVPTFGQPASDNLFTCDPLTDGIPKVPIGRLSVINGDEVVVYLNKVKQYEQQLTVQSPLIRDKAWYKNVVQVVGASEPNLNNSLQSSMNRFKAIIQDTFYGANVHSFNKLSTASVEQTSATKLYSLFEEGIGLLTYFGHSSASTLEFNLDNPDAYNNNSKYPMFILLGCNAGNFYNFNLARLVSKETISEKFVLAEQRGSIATLASTHLGIVHYLDIYNTRMMYSASVPEYGHTIGEIMREAVAETFAITSQDDFYARFHTEQTTLHGDPALRLTATFAKPDYVIEDQLVKVSPGFVSLAENSFRVDAKFMNIGKAIARNIVIQVSRTYPSGQTEIVRRDTIPGIRFIDSLSYQIPILATRDKGLNRITIKVEADEEVDELYETNNSITKDVFIFEDEIRPVFPYNYSIVGSPSIRFQASTANPQAILKQYRFELDTSRLFNSPQLRSITLSSVGGVLEFNPSVSYADNTVYYWRVAPVPQTGPFIWNSSSFLYISNHLPGYNQSHYFQHLDSRAQRMRLTEGRSWQFDSLDQNIFIRNAIFPEGGTQQAEYTVSINGATYIGGGCNYNAIIFNVFEPNTMIPWQNSFTPGGGLYGSLSQSCGPMRQYNFEFLYTDTLNRRRIMNFINNVVPDGYIVTARGNIPSGTPSPPAFAQNWKSDTTFFGSGVSLYHTLANQGIPNVDTFNRPRTFIFLFVKNRQAFFPARSVFAQTIYDKILLSADIPSIDSAGTVESPVFGPAKAWRKAYIKGDFSPGISATDSVQVSVYGIDNSNNEVELVTITNPLTDSLDLSGISAMSYPNLRLKLFARDRTQFTPYQLRHWRITYEPVPEGAIAPNIFFSSRDTFEVGEPLDIKVAFKNVSNVAFDSLKVKVTVTDQNNVTNIIPLPRKRPLTVYGTSGDTVQLSAPLSTANFSGLNTLYIEANPDNDQPEQYHFNNFLFRNFFVRPDSLRPLLDVTFDGVHILNRDIVSAKPDILVKLRDESRWLVLNDTSLLTLQIRHPNGTLRRYYFNNDTVRFTPAGQAPSTDNQATVNIKPYFTTDGEYELIISGRDRSNNKAGDLDYRVLFQVINKPMISNLLNYPNPFTTSTAFVFTITGTEVPQNMKIEIMTVTGKIVREITKDELGPLQIGRNITAFKWDGTDQFGQKLANGVYLYRVVTNLNGKALDKYKAEGDNTDKYFNKGYGKMYLMR